MENVISKVTVLNLTSMEIFFIITTVLSIFINLYQLMIALKDKAALKAPLTNSLVALFNDVKTKATSVAEVQQLVLLQQNPHTEIATLKWDYLQFTKYIYNTLLGFQEGLVGVLVTLNPQDKTGEKSFKASDYGVTAQEKEIRQYQMDLLKNKFKQQVVPDSSPKQVDPDQKVK